MTREQQLRRDMFRKVQKFGGTHGKRFSKTSAGSQAFATVTAALADIERFATARVRTGDDGTLAKAAARDAMVEQLKEVARTARLAARSVPAGATMMFQVPRWRRTDAELIATVGAVIRGGRAATARLTPLGLSGSFVERLETLVDQFLEGERKKQAGQLGLAAARDGFAAAMTRATSAVQTLDVIIANIFKKDATVLAEWKRARHWKPRRAAAPPPRFP